MVQQHQWRLCSTKTQVAFLARHGGLKDPALPHLQVTTAAQIWLLARECHMLWGGQKKKKKGILGCNIALPTATFVTTCTSHWWLSLILFLPHLLTGQRWGWGDHVPILKTAVLTQTLFSPLISSSWLLLGCRHAVPLQGQFGLRRDEWRWWW